MKLLFQKFYWAFSFIGRFVIERLLYDLHISDLAASINGKNVVLPFENLMVYFIFSDHLFPRTFLDGLHLEFDAYAS